MSESTKKETFGFQAEVKQVLHLMIHSLYSNKEIFLRELISNASDAADKLRFESLRDPLIMVEDPDLKIWLSYDKEAGTITIRDNGIGMNREEVIQNLGTIAKSGTREFLNSLTGDKAKDAKLIGQFGVGFYSSFIVADKVVVTTRRAGLPASEGVRWISNGEGEYELETVNVEKRGTEVVLHLKKEEEEFLNDWRLKHIVTKYSDHLTLPVVMKNEKGEEEVINRATALWTLPKNEITDEQYKELYKHVAHDFEDPMLWSHNKVEGKLEYISLLYIPSRAPFDLWHVGKTRGLKLYVRRVFIMDDAEQFLPHYLRFVRGIIDSNDLPLNISREILQNSRVIDAIKTAIVKRVLSMLEQLAGEDKAQYQKFWKEFGQALKEGPAEDFANKEQIAKLLRFASTHSNNEEQTASLEDYIARMSSGQDKIYYVTAETFNAAKNSPHLEIFRKKGIEVLLLTDRVDEWLMTHMTEFQGKSFQSVARGGLDLGDLADKTSEEHYKVAEEDFSETLKKIKEILTNDIKEVRLSRRLTDSPACIVLDEKDLSNQMEKLLRAAGQPVPSHKPILELNPDNPMVQRLKIEVDKSRFEDWVRILFDQAVLAEGRQLEDPATFVKRFNHLLMELVK
jgi:molecular chaperone HtpG